MRRTLIVSTIAFGLAFALWCAVAKLRASASLTRSGSPAAAGQAAQLGAGTVTHDLGLVPRRAIVRSTIVLENGQDAPVAVRIDGTSCECTSVELASQTVPPLGTTELAVALDTRNRTGQVRSEVALRSPTLTPPSLLCWRRWTQSAA
jgi:hypothetical protein